MSLMKHIAQNELFVLTLHPKFRLTRTQVLYEIERKR